MRGWQKFGSFVLLIILSVVCSPAQDHHVARQFDPTITVDLDVGRFRYDFYVGREKSEELEAGDTIFGAGVRFRAKPIFKTFFDAIDTDKKHVLVLRMGYEYRHGGEDGFDSNTHTAMTDATLRWGFPKKVLMADRNRAELRWIDGEASFRYRNRLLFERPFTIFKRKVAPYASAEAYWDGRFTSWNKFRYTAGAEVQAVWRTTVDVYYARERCVTCPDPHTDILGANITLFFKLKK